MSTNPLNDISKVYLEKVASVSEGKKAKPDYLDFDDDGNETESMKKALKDKKKNRVMQEELKGNQHKIDVAPPFGKLTSSDFKKLRKGKVTKEGFSNWREELSEIAEIVGKEKNDEKITEKKVNNKVKINPTLGEAVEELGGTLLEMVEIDEIDYIVESVYTELLDEGYEDDDIEEALEYALIEAKVTFGHDTPTGEKKRKNLIGAVSRLARQKLSSKVRGAKSAAAGAIASGARSVAKGALKVARKMEGDKKPHPAHTRTRRAATYSGAGAGQRERVSSGSYTPPSRTSSSQRTSSATQSRPSQSQIRDPWEGSYSTSSRSQSRPSQSSKSTKPSTPSDLVAKRKKAAMRAVRRNPNISAQDLERISSSIKEAHYSLATKKVEPGEPGEAHKKAREALAKTATTKKKSRKPVGTSRRGSGSFKPSSPEDAKSSIKSWGHYWSSAAKGYKEEYELLEKAESEQQQKIFGLALSVKRGKTSRDKVSDKVLKIVDGMSEKEIRKFAKTPHKGLPHKVETKEEAIRQELVARMVEKIEEQSEEYIDEAKLSRTEKRAKSAGKKKGNSKTMSLVDLDDNAMKEKKKGVGAKIEVKSGGETKKSLTPQEFNHYKFKDGEKPDFKQFRSSKVFKKTLKGNKHVRNLHRGSDASGLTARGGMDNNREVVKHVRDSGFNKKHGVNFKGVHFTGDVPGKGTDDKKMKVIKNLIKSRKPKTIKFSDDHAKNLSAPEKFNREEGKDKNKNRGSSTPKIKTYLTRDDGRPVRFGSGGRGVRDSGNVNPASSTKENQRRRNKARKGMGEAVEMTSQTQTGNTQQTSLSPKERSASQKAKQTAIALKQKELQALRSTPAGTPVSGFGG